MNKISRMVVLPVVIALTLAGCGGAPEPELDTPPAGGADLSGIRSYLLAKVAELGTQSSALRRAGDEYYTLIQSHDFDYAAAWQSESAPIAQAISDARAAWMAASPLYEQMEGIVAGVPSLADYDVILDAGASGAEDPDNAVPFDLVLPGGEVLHQPGNLFGVTESTLWGTWAEYNIPVEADLDGDGSIEFGETTLPDARVLTAATAMMQEQVAELQRSAEAWQPNESDAFTALVVMVPTMSEYFESWKNSRFVAGDRSQQRDFVVISRLADIQDILGSLQVVYAGVRPMVSDLDPTQADQIEQGLTDLRVFVADVYAQEQDGKRFLPEEADRLSVEAQDRATAITGQISQVAGRLGVDLAE